MIKIKCAEAALILNKVRIMGVINITPDSFYATSRCVDMDTLFNKAETMLKSGADILDIGGESTSKMVHKFGYNSTGKYIGGDQVNQSDSVSVQEEICRVIPVIEALKKRFDCIISIDTSSGLVIQEAALAGAGMINDVRALYRPGALEAAAKTRLPIVLTYSLVNHPALDFVPQYNDVVQTIVRYLKKAVVRCNNIGISSERLIVDPGFGGGLFGKLPEHDLSLLKRLNEVVDIGLPVLVGLSRKSLIGAVLNCEPENRLYGSLAAALIAAQKGAHIIRVHDVKATLDVVRFFEAVYNL